MTPDHIKIYPMDELKKSAYKRFADILRMYAGPILEEAIHYNLEQAHTLFADAAPRLAESLIALGLDERLKDYTAVSAISEAFKILQQGVVVVSAETSSMRSDQPWNKSRVDPPKLLKSKSTDVLIEVSSLITSEQLLQISTEAPKIRLCHAILAPSPSSCRNCS